jgi:hypothetical protein
MEKADLQEKLQESNSSHEQVGPISQFVLIWHGIFINFCTKTLEPWRNNII